MLPLRFYWMLLLRRLPLMAAVVFFCTAFAIYYALNMAPVYTSFARLQVEAPQIPDDMVASIVETGASEQLQLIQERLLTRANLLKIAREHQVFDTISEMTPDEIVNMMTLATEIERSSGRDEAAGMRIAFTAGSGETSADVVNAFTTLVLEDNASSRRQRAESTLSFFEQETERLAAEIEAQSNRIIAFKTANLEALPEDLNFRQQRQGILLERLSRLEQERVSLVTRRSEMITLFETTGRLDSELNLTPEQERLQELKQQLNEATAVYSDTNPRVIILRNQVNQLEAALVGVAEETPDDEGSVAPRGSMIDITLREMDQRVEEIDREVVLVDQELEELGGIIGATTTNAISLERLENDLESIRDRYNDTLDNLNQARMTERVEVNAQGQRITLIEGAVVPELPSGTSRAKVAVAGMGAGIMLAGGLFVLLELLNQKLRHPTEVQSRFNIVPIGIIPYMETRREKMQRRMQILGATAASLVAVSLALYYLHTQFMPLEVLADRILLRLGLV